MERSSLAQNVSLHEDTRQSLSTDLAEAGCFSRANNRSKVNPLEVRSALSMSVNILPFWLSTFPVTCQAMALYWCMLLEANCYPLIFENSSYLRDLFMTHTIYNPLMYMFTSAEFRRAFFHIVWKLKKNMCWLKWFHQQQQKTTWSWKSIYIFIDKICI